MQSNRQSSTYMRKFLFCFLILTSANVCSLVRGEDAGSNHSQPGSASDEHGILIVSCVDGNLHGINTENGELIWQISNPPLVSQSLSKLEFTRDGKRYRLIPSLEGQLYMLEIDGDNNGLRALPINADALFSSTFQLSADSILVGGKDQRVFGFNPYTGEIKYRCDKDGCEQDSSLPPSKERCDLLISRRVSHVVRAVHLDTGHEQWNFSVGQDNVVSIDKDSYPQHGPLSQGGAIVGDTCITVQDSVPSDSGSIRWAFGVELGDVEASMKPPFSRLLWKRRLSSSLSRVWLLQAGSVKQLALFVGDARSRIHQLVDEVVDCPRRRSLYLGVFDGHMYVQLEDGNARAAPRPQYISLSTDQDESAHRPLPDSSLNKRHRVSKMTRYELTTKHHGFFKPSLKDPAVPVDLSWFIAHNALGDRGGDLHPPFTEPLVVRYGSFVFQKLALCCLLVVICHLLFTNLYLPYHLRCHSPVQHHHQQPLGGLIAAPRPTGAPACASGGHDSPSATDKPLVSLDWTDVDGAGDRPTPGRPHYESRYDSDFEHVRCLGRGAFGVVFEARHRVDQYSYAVKRIRVRYSEQARTKMLQEVRAFAHLEHPGIVRYYQAWFELPPPGWQERKDLELGLKRDDDDYEGTTGTEEERDDTASSASTAATSGSTRGIWSRQDDEHGVHWTRSISDCTNDSGFIIFDRSAPLSGIGCVTAAAAAPGNSESDGATGEPPERAGSVGGTGPQGCTHIYLYISMHLYSSRSLRDWLRERQQARHGDALIATSTESGAAGPTQVTRAPLLLHIFGQIVDAVAYLHGNGLMHRDLKPSNILFDDRGHIRIVDFGLATSLLRSQGTGPLVGTTNSISSAGGVSTADGGRPGENPAGGAPCSLTGNVGTELYMSPEQQQHRSVYDQKVDVFALGIIFIELVVPLDTEMERVIVLSKARRAEFDPWITAAFPTEIEFASRLLHVDPKARPTCEEILDDELLAPVADEMRTRRRSRSSTIE